MTPTYRKMILEGELTPIGELSAAFLSPPSAMHLQFAYFESMLVVEFIVKNYGYDALKNILADLAKSEDIRYAISQHTKPLSALEKDFEEYAKKRANDLAPDVDWEEPEQINAIARDPNSLEKWLEGHPNSLWALTQYAQNLLSENNFDKAKEILNKIIDLYPEYTSSDSAYIILAQLHQKLGETDKEKEVLEKICEYSSDSVYAYSRLLDIALEQKNWQDVVTNCQRYFAVNPHMESIYLHLSSANEKLGNDNEAIEGYQKLLKLDYPDQAELNYRIGRLMEDKNPDEAKRYVLSALAEAPRFRDAHKLLLKIVEQAENENETQESPENTENQI